MRSVLGRKAKHGCRERMVTQGLSEVETRRLVRSGPCAGAGDRRAGGGNSLNKGGTGAGAGEAAQARSAGRNGAQSLRRGGRGPETQSSWSIIRSSPLKTAMRSH